MYSKVIAVFFGFSLTLFFFGYLLPGPLGADPSERRVLSVVEKLSSPKEEIRERAIERLVNWGRLSLPHLLRALEDFDPRMVTGACRVIAELRSSRAAPSVAKLLGAEQTWGGAVKCLQALGMAGFNAAKRVFFTSSSPVAREHAGLVLSHFPREGLDILLHRGLSCEDSNIRVASCRAMANTLNSKGAEYFPLRIRIESSRQLIELLKSEGLEVDVWAVRALGALALERSEGALIEQADEWIEALDDSYVRGRERARIKWGIKGVLRAIAQVGGKRAPGFLLNLLNTGQGDLQRWSVSALGSLKEPGVIPDLGRVALHSPERWTRKAACTALSRIGTARAKAVLKVVSLLDEDEELRLHARRAAERIRVSR